MTLRNKLRLDMKRNYQAYIMVMPAVITLLIFSYIPMYGIIIAFKDYKPAIGFMESKWVGLENFNGFFSSIFFPRLMRNTLAISLLSLLFGFPAPIIMALLLNEVSHVWFKRTVQTITYMPYFISTVVVCGIIKSFLTYDGVLNQIASYFGRPPESFLSNPSYFRAILISSDLWQFIGWNSIIYLAALSAIDMQLYDAAKIDGAGRLRQIRHVTLPGIAPTATILLILAVGRLMSVGCDKIILLYTPLTYETADIISSYVYRRGIQYAEYSYTTAVGLFNTVINVTLLILANWFSSKYSETSLW